MGGDGLNSVQPLRYIVGAEYHSAHFPPPKFLAHFIPEVFNESD